LARCSFTGLYFDTGRVGAIHLVQIDWRLVPQQGTAFTLPGIDLRIFFLQFIDELGDFGLVVIVLFAEHGVFGNWIKTAVILPCLGSRLRVSMNVLQLATYAGFGHIADNVTEAKKS
jgi:hypothetical protein